MIYWLILLFLTTTISTLMGYRLGRLKERMEWNELIENGLIPRPTLIRRPRYRGGKWEAE